MPDPAPRLARRLRRILVLLPYAIKHPGVSVDELARKFSVPRGELLDDLNLLFMCGLPGYGPGDLIDVSVDEDHVYVRMADYFAAPLRLTPVEALSLYAGGAAMAAMPEMEEADALRRGLAKLGRALGASDGAGATAIDVRFETGPDQHVATIRSALAESRRVRIEYFSASTGALAVRDVDPWALYAALGRWYLIGWDHLRADERMFRTDRIKSIAMLDEPAPVPDDFDPASYKGAFKARAGQPVAFFELSPRAARWFEEYYPVTEGRDLPDGWRATGLAYSSEEWLARLLLSLGEDVRAVRPASVMERVGALAAEILDVYQTA
jgi:proteasome accessory factor C